ncbi:hypothetical protein [Euzebya sp.]|uniref:hypothetical protein n=1 Tax=Euzebya sp. TaxID=1971409 RepID=UPI0035120ADD
MRRGRQPGDRPTSWSLPAHRPARDRSRWRRLHHHLRTTEIRTRSGAVVAALAVLAAVAGPGVVVSTRAAALPTTLALVVAVPEGTTAGPDLVAAVEHEAQLAAAWLEAQTGGTLRGDLRSARVVEVPLDDAPLPGHEDDAAAAVEDAVGLRRIDPDLLPVVVTPLALADAPDTCGLGGPVGVVVFLGNCDARRGCPPARSATGSTGRSRTSSCTRSAAWPTARRTPGRRGTSPTTRAT